MNLHSVTLDCIMRAGLTKGVCPKQEVRLSLRGYGEPEQVFLIIFVFIVISGLIRVNQSVDYYRANYSNLKSFKVK